MKSDSHSYAVGDFAVTCIKEKLLSGFTPHRLYPDWNKYIGRERERPMDPVCWDETGRHLVLSTHSWLVRGPKYTLLVDTGIGNHKTRRWPFFDQLNEPFLQRLDAAGVHPENVDYVLLTHLHTDHVGWNTQLVDGRWIPTFPNARYVFSKAEHEYFSGPGGKDRPNYALYEDSVLPVIDAGQAEMIDAGGGEFLEGIVFHSTPGHSIDHFSIGIESRGNHALFAGDVMHLPVQVDYPDLSSAFSANPECGRRSRLWALRYAADHEAIVFSSHFPGTSTGQIERLGEHFAWKFASPTRPTL
jgi:glyoxylase-like metal-dependent hydrolase (beta-lactamase superfamily II)